MLGKLMKHEFRATGRAGLPLCGVMVALAVIAGLAIRFLENDSGPAFQDVVGSLSIILFLLSIFAVAVGIFIILMQSFKRNLLGDEGYLMRVLPVSVHKLLLSKLFVALLWFVASTLLIGLSVLLMAAVSGEVYVSDFRELLQALREGFHAIDGVILVQILLGWIGGMAFLTLLFYADFTLTQNFSKHKVLYNVMGVVIFIVLLRLIFGLNNALDASLFRAGELFAGEDWTATFQAAAVRSSWIRIAEVYLFDVLLYFLTWGFLRYRPNLE